MIKFRSVFIVIVLAVVVAMGVACSSKEAPSQTAGANEEGQPAAMEQGDQAAMEEQQSQAGGEMAQQAEEAAQMPKSVELTGMVEQGDNGVVIVTDLGKYNVIGQDLSSMVGKTVKVTGALEESAGEYTINVESVEESH
jgi:hypothetical protein